MRRLPSCCETTRERFGYAILIDCHSMPSASMAPRRRPRPDFVLGDRFGASCDCKLTRFMKDVLQRRRLRGADQPPLCGRLHHRALRQPGARRARVQIEINRGLYLDELTLAKSGFAEAAARPAEPGRRRCSRAARCCSSGAQPRNRSSIDRPNCRAMRIIHAAAQQVGASSSSTAIRLLTRQWPSASPARTRTSKLQATRQRKRAVRVTNGPSLGRKRPRRATTTRAELAMSHRKTYGCVAQYSNAFFAELHLPNRQGLRKGWLTAWASFSDAKKGRSRRRTAQV